MTPEEFEARMRALLERKAHDFDYDRQQLHEDIDDLLCETLASLGYEAGVEVFNSVKKWYA